MQDILTKLTAKKLMFLHEHLRKAILDDRVETQYKPFLSKQSHESKEAYINRIRQTVAEYQFVEVEDSKKDKKYIAFGTPGPVVNNANKMYCLPAEVVGGKWGVHHILIYPDLENLLLQKEVTLRIDSGCFSGMVLGDTTCDCLAQLRIAQEAIIKKGSGIVIEIPGHDGRGWGEYKMANQLIMDELNLDTIETARLFYGDTENIDIRSYDESMLILKALGFTNKHVFELASANPNKHNIFKDYGFRTTLNKEMVYGDTVQPGTTQNNINAKLKHWNVLL